MFTNLVFNIKRPNLYRSGTEGMSNFNQAELNKPEDDITFDLHDVESFVKKIPLFALPSKKKNKKINI